MKTEIAYGNPEAFMFHIGIKSFDIQHFYISLSCPFAYANNGANKQFVDTHIVRLPYGNGNNMLDVQTNSVPRTGAPGGESMETIPCLMTGCGENYCSLRVSA